MDYNVPSEIQVFKSKACETFSCTNHYMHEQIKKFFKLSKTVKIPY